MASVADVIRLYGSAYLDKFEGEMPQSHIKALHDLLYCRSSGSDGYLYSCECCGHTEYVPVSCCNRACPQCCARKSREWCLRQKTKLLPVEYFHLVFTLPSELRLIMRYHQKILYPLLFQNVWSVLKEFGYDEKHIGGQIGATMVLHTWGSGMIYHPHIHVLMPAGAINDQGLWQGLKFKAFLFPVKAISKVFQFRFLDAIKKAIPQQILPSKVWRMNWNVYCRESSIKTENVINYLGRYMHKVAISNSNIISVDEKEVVFKTRSRDDNQWHVMTLSGEEFLRRFLQHVLPKGMAKVRSYGILHPSNKKKIAQLQALALLQNPQLKIWDEIANAQEDLKENKHWQCPSCEQGSLEILYTVTNGRVSVNRRSS